MRVHKFIWA